MKKLLIVILCLCLCLIGLSSHAQEAQKDLSEITYAEYWRQQSPEAKLTLLTAYIKGFYDGSCSFGTVYQKLFGKSLTLEQLAAGDRAIPVPATKIVEYRAFTLDFMEFAYKGDEYKNINIYNMMNTGLICAGKKISPNECLFLFGDMLKAKEH